MYSHLQVGLRFGAALAALMLSACGGAQLNGAPSSGALQRVSRPLAFQQNDGSQFVQYSVPCPTALGQMTAGPDGNEWFDSDATCGKHVNRGSIGQINVITGQVSEWIIGRSRAAQPGGIASNAGYLWVADEHEYGFAGGYLLQINTSGQQIAVIGIGRVTAQELTVGPDGNVWFTGAKGVSRQKPIVGYVTPERGVEVFPFKPKLHVDPASVSAGPDNNIWVTDRANGILYQIQPATGTMTPFKVGGHPAYLTHDSNLLEYSDAETAQISTMTVKGVVNVYPAPAGQFPGRLARKPDGTVVYIDDSTGEIGTFVAATGVYGPELDPPGGDVTYLANGPDGNLWFDTSSGNVGAYLKFILTTSPSSLQWSGPPSGCSPQTLLASETSYSGSFSATSADPSIASVTQTGNSSFSVTPGMAGTTTINLADGQSNDVNVAVSVSSSCGSR